MRKTNDRATTNGGYDRRCSSGGRTLESGAVATEQWSSGNVVSERSEAEWVKESGEEEENDFLHSFNASLCYCQYGTMGIIILRNSFYFSSKPAMQPIKHGFMEW
nr:hypothetical protein Iba_chr05aCG5370 [Ipomoea batatas]GMD32352.1 hypothetical protein Iba_chr09bCG7420 [Ipomoea batatas]